MNANALKAIRFNQKSESMEFNNDQSNQELFPEFF